MADPGAAKIKSLLDTPNDSLGDLMDTLQTAMSQAQHDNNLTVPNSTFSAINALRTYYRDLGNNVNSISTSSPAKGDVLGALEQLDASLVSLAKALHEGAGDNATADLKASEQQSDQASAQLVRASEALG